MTALFTHATKIYNLKDNPCTKVKRMGRADADKKQLQKYLTNAAIVLEFILKLGINLRKMVKDWQGKAERKSKRVRFCQT